MPSDIVLSAFWKECFDQSVRYLNAYGLVDCKTCGKPARRFPIPRTNVFNHYDSKLVHVRGECCHNSAYPDMNDTVAIEIWRAEFIEDLTPSTTMPYWRRRWEMVLDDIDNDVLRIIDCGSVV